jgi:3-methylcrotonyl-CoA carboxylase alpha subunit
MSEIKSVLIANRAEIAVRVISTCKQMGIKTIAIYAEDDKDLRHVKLADEAYSLGSGPALQTYLDIEKVIAVAKKAGADAIHPGYGFLSENAKFATALKKAGIIFIGPPEDAITLMGSKKESKQKMESIGIPLVPGYHGDDQDAGLLEKEAKKIGFPLLIKASAGGGGKGMRIVREAGEFVEALDAAKSEALKAFNDDKVLLEKYIENPRHIEVQVVSDGQGNHFHFFERECSIQRRYQKIVEETPSVALDDNLRQRMCETAVQIAKGINYVGAGTIEYILAENKEYYFLEMNTRLQVEHPVTEMVTGVDLVRLQILAAEGKAFDFKQEDVTQRGHSIEVRIYSEDPDNNFLPATGVIQHIGKTAMAGVRLDTGYDEYNEVTINYDPMIAKLITFAPTRDEAIQKLVWAIDDYKFAGVKTNRDYLKRILDHDVFKAGNIDTHFIEKYAADLEKADFSDEELATLLAQVLVSSGEGLTSQSINSWDNIQNFRIGQ